MTQLCALKFRYPLYQKGNPQLRVFLPNFWMKLIKPTNNQPANVVQFHCSMEMTKYDIQNYLEKIYSIDITEVRTRIASGRTKKDRLQGAIIKEDDSKVAYVVLVSLPSCCIKFCEHLFTLSERNSSSNQNLISFF